MSFNTGAIEITSGAVKIVDGKEVLSSDDWDKIKENGNRKIPYKITVLKDGTIKNGAENNRLLKIAIYRDGTAVLENI